MRLEVKEMEATPERRLTLENARRSRSGELVIDLSAMRPGGAAIIPQR
jgi:hypothetical protein